MSDIAELTPDGYRVLIDGLYYYAKSDTPLTNSEVVDRVLSAGYNIKREPGESDLLFGRRANRTRLQVKCYELRQSLNKAQEELDIAIEKEFEAKWAKT